MVKLRRGHHVALLTALICLAYLAGLAATILVTNHIDLRFHLTAESGASYLSIYVLLISVAAMIVLLPAMIAVGIATYLDGEEQSKLYFPFLLGKMAVTGVFLISGIAAVDLLTHDLKLGWRLTDEPELRVVTNMLILLYAGANIWWTWITLRGRKISAAVAVTLLVGAVGVVVLIVAVNLWLAGLT